MVHKPDDQDALDLLGRIKQVEEGAEPKGDVFTDIATPTLAELYYSQGQIQEAISTYEKILSKNPEDKATMHRLAGLHTLTSEQTRKQIRNNDKLNEEKKKMIAILQEWLNRIQELSHVS